jgi:hypothetical protein
LPDYLSLGDSSDDCPPVRLPAPDLIAVRLKAGRSHEAGARKGCPYKILHRSHAPAWERIWGRSCVPVHPHLPVLPHPPRRGALHASPSSDHARDQLKRDSAKTHAMRLYPMGSRLTRMNQTHCISLLPSAPTIRRGESLFARTLSSRP